MVNTDTIHKYHIGLGMSTRFERESIDAMMIKMLTIQKEIWRITGGNEDDQQSVD